MISGETTFAPTPILGLGQELWVHVLTCHLFLAELLKLKFKQFIEFFKSNLPSKVPNISVHNLDDVQSVQLSHYKASSRFALISDNNRWLAVGRHGDCWLVAKCIKQQDKSEKIK